MQEAMDGTKKAIDQHMEPFLIQVYALLSFFTINYFNALNICIIESIMTSSEWNGRINPTIKTFIFKDGSNPDINSAYKYYSEVYSYFLLSLVIILP